MLKLTLLVTTLISLQTFAEPTPPQVMKQKNSKCTAITNGGEYPTYKFKINNKTIFSPKSDGVVSIKFSPSGRFLAISGGEVSLIDLNKNNFEYGLIIINCISGKIKGYRKGKPTAIKWWWKDDLGLSFYDGNFLKL